MSKLYLILLFAVRNNNNCQIMRPILRNWNATITEICYFAIIIIIISNKNNNNLKNVAIILKLWYVTNLIVCFFFNYLFLVASFHFNVFSFSKKKQILQKSTKKQFNQHSNNINQKRALKNKTKIIDKILILICSWLKYFYSVL